MTDEQAPKSPEEQLQELSMEYNVLSHQLNTVATEKANGEIRAAEFKARAEITIQMLQEALKEAQAAPSEEAPAPQEEVLVPDAIFEGSLSS